MHGVTLKSCSIMFAFAVVQQWLLSIWVPAWNKRMFWEYRTGMCYKCISWACWHIQLCNMSHDRS